MCVFLIGSVHACVCADILLLCTIMLWLGSNIQGLYYSGPCYSDEKVNSKLSMRVCVSVCDNNKKHLGGG